MTYKFREFSIPERMMDAIRRYIDRGLQPGDFLMAVIDNDLAEAVKCADDENIQNLPAYVAYFYNEAPGSCWGSREKRISWMRHHFDMPVRLREEDDNVSVPTRGK